MEIQNHFYHKGTKNTEIKAEFIDSYAWDRANRLLSMGDVDYQYKGKGRRVQQTVSSTIVE